MSRRACQSAATVSRTKTMAHGPVAAAGQTSRFFRARLRRFRADGTSNVRVDVIPSGSMATRTNEDAMVQIAGNAPPEGTVGDLYAFTFTATGDNPATQWVADGTLPAGLQLVPNTGVLSGRLAEAGTYPFTVRVTDTASQSESHGFTIIVNPKLVMLDDMTPSGAPQGAQAEVLAELRADGGVKPYKWAVAP